MGNFYDTRDNNVTRVELDLIKFGVVHHLSKFELDTIDFDITVDRMAHEVAYRFHAVIAGQKLTTIKYPSNWKESFKERWFPKWLLNKYPVKYKVINATALYPQVSIPLNYQKPVFHFTDGDNRLIK